MSHAFAAALSHVLRYEGGYSNHPLDPGGSTFKGITQRTLNRLRPTNPGFSALVQELTIEQVALIYRVEYWDAVRGDDLPEPIALLAFDCAVNQGPAMAIKLLQRAVRVEDDGVLGPVTMKAVRERDPRALTKEYAARRMFHYMILDSLDDTFGLGWSRRMVDVLDRALLLVPSP